MKLRTKLEQEYWEIGYIEALGDAIAIFRKLPEDEPMTKNPVILELQVLKQRSIR